MGSRRNKLGAYIVEVYIITYIVSVKRLVMFTKIAGFTSDRYYMFALRVHGLNT